MIQPEEAVEAIHTVHSLLATVCEDSGLQGMEYTGGPMCPHCKWVLPVLQYGKDGKKAYNINEKIPCKNRLCMVRNDAKLLLEVSHSAMVYMHCHRNSFYVHYFPLCRWTELILILQRC